MGTPKKKAEYMIESEADHECWHRNQAGYGKVLHKTGNCVGSYFGTTDYVGLCGASVTTKGWVSNVTEYKKCSKCLRLISLAVE